MRKLSAASLNNLPEIIQIVRDVAKILAQAFQVITHILTSTECLLFFMRQMNA